MLVHYHVEKTAGSSFRDLCLEYFGAAACGTLYGPSSKSTSTEMRDLIYPDGVDNLNSDAKADRLIEYLQRRRPSFFSTHFIAPLRRRMQPGVTTVAFFREPVARVVSHYNHWHLKGHFTGEFRDFYQRENFRNWQSQRFSLEEMAGLSFACLTEEFGSSIAMLNAELGVALAPRHTNKTPWRPFQIRLNSLNDRTRREIAQLNAKDIELYDAVRQRFYRDLKQV